MGCAPVHRMLSAEEPGAGGTTAWLTMVGISGPWCGTTRTSYSTGAAPATPMVSCNFTSGTAWFLKVTAAPSAESVSVYTSVTS